MYQPTKNLSQILRAEDYTEHELFETEAVREAQARFKAGLKGNLMYRPTKNWCQASLNPTEREAFKQAAREQATEAFNDYLVDNGFGSREHWKEWLRQCLNVTELHEDAFAESEEAYGLYMRAYDPHIDPETSFNLTVEAMAIEERVRAYNEIIDEKEAQLAAKSQNHER